MRYDISSNSAPAMPNLGRGTECIKLLLSQASQDMYEPLVPMFFPVLGAHISGTEFMYPDNSWKEPCGMMANLVGKSSGNKGQFSTLAEAICRDFSNHDKEEEKKFLAWQKQKNAKGANKDKPEEPQLAYWFPPSDTTKPAFLKNAIALEAQGGRTQYFNMPEVEMADQLCGSHKKLSQLLRNVYDRGRAGALRATADGVTGNPILRANLTFSSTLGATRRFYKYELFNGTFGRMVFSFKPRGERSGRIPRQGTYPDEFYLELDEYLERLDASKGRYMIRPLNKLIDRLAQDMATLADLTDDDLLFELSHRSLISAWKAGCVLWILNNQTWTKAMGDLVEWLVYHDLWSKMQIFADMLNNGEEGTSAGERRGPKNMLDDLPSQFNKAQLEALRTSMNKPIEGTSNQLRKWLHRKFIEYCAQTGLYTKTEEYLKKVKI
ncbi:hypothetical protein [Prevotella sp. P6B1]|uniref:hypothetical protein n=1 Tax=Prevotella sp. P6B1 TaxID=1410613 RepID=UPI0012DBEEF6|nr:hypothetical protein [Prevotella sp. P6B1]